VLGGACGSRVKKGGGKREGREEGEKVDATARVVGGEGRGHACDMVGRP
jgi:hypothetical protein